MNRKFLTKLVENGPEKYPGAKILEKANGENIYSAQFVGCTYHCG